MIQRIFILILLPVLYCGCKSKQSESTREASSEVDGIKVPDGFSIERAVDSGLVTYPMFASFDEMGRLFVFESDGSTPSTEEMLKKPSFFIRLLEDTNEDGIFDRSKIFADSLTYPKGGVFYQGSLYVTSCPDFLKLTDTNGDGVADKREVLLTGWVLHHNGALLGGPFLGPDGWMYLTDARRGFNITTKEGEKLKGTSARIWRCRPDGSELEWICGGGYDNAVELVFMPSGETVGTMTYFTDPQGGMRDALMHWVEGGVYPKPLDVIQTDKYKLTGDLMPVMTKTARVAPSGVMRYRGSSLGRTFTGNLFSAEFNTGRIMRHKITRDGGTYTTEEEPFINSTDSDMHFTDVLEDADGSLLVLNTGGWFIAGCPLSRMAKLNIHGGIYRIKNADDLKKQDPRGLKFDVKSLSSEDLIGYIMNDERPAVRDRVIDHLVSSGESAVDPIKNLLLKSPDDEFRATAIFALYRINTPNAFNVVMTGLDDTSVTVKTAAVRVLGMAKYKQAVQKLMDLLKKNQSAVRRQAATALGQIGDKTAVSALLNAAADKNDRVTEHSIIHSLITLKNNGALKDALKHPSSNVRRSALIALDQMDGSTLSKKDIIPFFNSDDTLLLNTGMWVATHHPNWGDVVSDFLKSRFAAANNTERESTPVRDLMISFSKNKQVQNLIGKQLSNISVPRESKEFLLDVIGQSTVKEIPAVWIRPLGKLLNEGDQRTRTMILKLIESRRITSLNTHLTKIIHDTTMLPDFRLKALGSRIASNAKLSEREFRMAVQYLDKKNESPVRQQAARVLSVAKLNTAQLIQLAKDHLATSDIFLMPNLINAFEGSKNSSVGESLIAALNSSSDRLDNLSEQDLERLLKEYPQSVKSGAEPLKLKLRERNAARLHQLQAVESKLKKGNIGDGRKLYFGKAMCSTCHAIGSNGGDFGPDLTNIGEIRSRHDILEAVLFPGASFAREYESFNVVTKAATYTGVIREQSPEAIVIATGPGQDVRVNRTEITRIEPHSISMMPPGLDKQLTPEELSDLIAYLVSLPDGMSGREWD